MDYGIVRLYAESAYRNFKSNNQQCLRSLNHFYSEGKKNPSVAKIILQSTILRGYRSAHDMLKELSTMPTPTFFDYSVLGTNANIYSYALNGSLKAIEAKDLYKTSSYIVTDGENIKKSPEKYEFDAVWNKLYPKTGKIRERIIEENRISMDKVNKKAGWFEKINYANTISGYQRLYPKTFYTRFALIMNDQINENGTTPRVKNWFKRFSYKKLINGKFRFNRTKKTTTEINTAAK